MRTPEYTGIFKRDYKRAMRRNYDIALIDAVIRDLIDEVPLNEKCKDHALDGDYAGCRECHIKPDWLLVY